MSTPFIGIAMATYNPLLPYFIGQISSLRKQTYKNWKCIIVDDRSSEENLKLIQDVIGDDPRFEIHRNETNLGSFKTFERALQLIPQDAEYICYCDQDDIWQEAKLEVQVAVLQDPSIALVHSDQSLIDEKNRVFAPSCWELEGRRVRDASTDLLLFRNLITGCTSMFRRGVLETALPFYPLRERREMYHHDMWVAMHACVHGRVIGLEEPLVFYRQHRGNLVGVASVKRDRQFRKLTSRACLAFTERWGLRKDFIQSLKQNELQKQQEKKLRYLDHPLELLLYGSKHIVKHPVFLRTLIMLGVGLLKFKQHQRLSPMSRAQ
jgi:glycosyltransferase involved in cell wall biosynthesis